MDAHSHQAVAFSFLGRLGTAVWPRLTASHPVHIQQVFDAAWTEGLSLPLREAKAASQTVALIDGMDFHRQSDKDAVAHAYQERQRTRVYESLNVRSDGWFSTVTLRLTAIMRHQVICTAYESHAGDRNLGAHDDEWLGVITQMRGAKRWLVWPETTGAPEEIVTRVGDVLILPQGVKHEVSTPDSPGYSVHLVFAITDELV
ncbi:JmjC domain-containing protein [Streptomyces malaysiensis]|uniref:JmjC domain-containing protein n=1 Tax=Streptomyces malaysiensis TaxID=92644 RepID=UPI0036A5375B